MTPLWREEIKAALNEKPGRLSAMGSKEALAKARCFDLREVQKLCYSTSQEMESGATPYDGGFLVDVGHRTCIPALMTWLEFNNSAIFIAGASPLPEGYADAFASGSSIFLVKAVYSDLSGASQVKYAFGIISIVDGVARIRGFQGNDRPNGLDEGAWRTFALMMLAALATINSPAAVRTPIENHRGWLKRLASSGVKPDPLIQHTRVTIGAGNYHHASRAGSGQPKAYHFCRAHTRLKNGKLERVRAHWRGDPAFGYRLPSYSVKAPAALIDGDAA